MYILYYMFQLINIAQKLLKLSKKYFNKKCLIQKNIILVKKFVVVHIE